MNPLDLPDDVLEDIARFLDAKAVAAFRAVSHGAAISRLVLANRVQAAYFALCRNDTDLFYATMPQYSGKKRGKNTQFPRSIALTLYAQVAKCLVRGNVGFPGRSWALLNAWTNGARLMSMPTMTELTRLALDRGASRALSTLLKYRGVDPLQLVCDKAGNTDRLAAFFRHPRMHGDLLRTEIALQLSLPLVHGAHPFPYYAQALTMSCDPELTLAYLSALDSGPASLQLLRCILEQGVCAHGPNFILLGVLKDAFYLSRPDLPHPPSSAAGTLESARSRLEAHVNGDSQVADLIVDWMVRIGANAVQSALVVNLNNVIVCLHKPEYVRWAARYLARDTALCSPCVVHTASLGMSSLLHNLRTTELAIAYLQGFPIDLTHLDNPIASQDCLACRRCVGNALNKDDSSQWIVRSMPASDLEIALARRAVNASLHNVLTKDPKATHTQWIRVLQNRYLRVGEMFRAWGELRRSENQLLLDAGIVEPLAFEHGLGGVGIHLSTVMAAYLIRIRNDMQWRPKFVDAIAAAREAWPEVVAGWRVDAKVVLHVLESLSGYTSVPPLDPHLGDLLAALAEREIPVDATPEKHTRSRPASSCFKFCPAPTRSTPTATLSADSQVCLTSPTLATWTFSSSSTPDVLDWCLAHGANIDSHLDNLFLQARDFCMLKSLEWLKQYAVEHGRDYAFPPFNAFDGTIFVSADRRVAMLAWWKADHESRSMPPLFGANDDFPTELASWAADGLLVVDWWRRYCVEMDRDFTWTALDETGLQNVVKYGSISLCQWWWDETVQEIGILHSNMFLADILNTICDSPQTEYLDWYWNLCTNTDGEIEIARDWRPRYPFVRLNVIQWWEAKVEAGFMDPSVFDIDQQRRNMFGFVGTLTTKLDALINQPRRHNLEIAALDWYWARRDRNGLEPNLSENAVLSMMQRRDPELLQWYLARCTPESPLPALTLDVVAAMVSRGQVDMLEQIFLVLETLNKPFDVTTTTEIEAPVLNRRIASSTVLDYLWEYCTRVNKRFEPCYNTKSAVLAIKAYDLDAAKWWYNMHRVHGMAFPSTKDLAGLNFVDLNAVNVTIKIDNTCQIQELGVLSTSTS
ncbi:hypothetical protein BC828DRAFT_404746 [Blastocladiella britannica]|nr:hypothetical protein BC828DRAFT_404746 [Blastocladiella britannica]